MIPIADSVKSRTFPYVNIAIIIANIAVFLYEVALSGDAIIGNYTELDRFIEHWANVPACSLDALGWEQDNAGKAICINQPEPLATPITSVFMHGGWLHLLGNMLFLWIFGDNVEDAMGHVRYGIFYVLVGVLAGLAHSAIDASSTTPALGASGAIAGVMAAYLVLFPWGAVRAFPFISIPMPAYVVIGIWFLSQLVYGYESLGDVDTATGGVAYAAHVGGFVAGAALVFVFALGRPRPKQKRRRFW